MKPRFFHTLLPFAASVTLAGAATILSPGDFVIGIDENPNRTSERGAGKEDQTMLFDGDPATKMFHSGRAFTGVIVTPADAGTVVKGVSFSTANDSSNRDPVKFQIYGTNDAITSANNSTGLGESWTLIGEGSTGIADASAAATARLTAAPVVSLGANDTAYNSYKIVFTELRSAGDAAGSLSNPNGLQLAEIQMFADETGATALFSGTPTVLVIDQTDSFSPPAENAAKAIDGNPETKYLNYGREGSGLIITPEAGSSVVQGLVITTANDAPGRDPASYMLFGTNEAILSLENSEGTMESWTLISSGALNLPEERKTEGEMVVFTNDDAYTSYKIVFPTVKDPDAANSDSLQFADIQLHSDVIPEPSAAGLLALGALGLLRRRRN